MIWAIYLLLGRFIGHVIIDFVLETLYIDVVDDSNMSSLYRSGQALEQD